MFCGFAVINNFKYYYCTLHAKKRRKQALACTADSPNLHLNVFQFQTLEYYQRIKLMDAFSGYLVRLDRRFCLPVWAAVSSFSLYALRTYAKFLTINYKCTATNSHVVLFMKKAFPV